MIIITNDPVVRKRCRERLIVTDELSVEDMLLMEIKEPNSYVFKVENGFFEDIKDTWRNYI